MNLHYFRDRALYKAGYAVGVRDAEEGYPLILPEDTPNIFDSGYEKGYADTQTQMSMSMALDIITDPLSGIKLSVSVDPDCPPGRLYILDKSRLVKPW